MTEITLDKFRDVDLVLDWINQSFISKQFVAQGDKNGRTFTVLITNNGEVGQTPGLTVNMRWYNRTSGVGDLSAFEVLDASTNQFQFTYPENMLTPGKVDCEIQILVNGTIAHTKAFQVTVYGIPGNYSAAIEGQEFTALTQILAKANLFESKISSLELNKQDKSKAEQDKKELKQSLSETKDKLESEVDNLSTGKVDKNGVMQVGWSNLDQTARDNIAGDKVAIVGLDSVGTVNIINKAVTNPKIANNAVTAEKTDFLIPTDNIFNKSKAVLGMIIPTQTGIPQENATHFYYGPIRMNAGDSISVAGETTEITRPFRIVTAFSVNGTLRTDLSWDNTSGSLGPFTASIDMDVYVSMKREYIDGRDIIINFGTSPAAYKPFAQEPVSTVGLGVSQKNMVEEIISESVIEERNTTFITLSNNLFDYRTANRNYFMELDGSLTADTNYYYTKPIKMKKGETIRALSKDGSLVNLRKVTTFSSENKAISDLGANNLQNSPKNNFTLTSDVIKTVTLSIPKVTNGTAPENLMLYISDEERTVFETYSSTFNDRVALGEKQLKQVREDLGSLNNKRLLSFGDSIAAGDGNSGKGYAEIIAESYNMNCTNYAAGGATLTKNLSSTNNIVSQIDSALLTETVAPDFVLINGRTNDLNPEYTDAFKLGEVAETYDTSTFNYDFDTFSGSLEYIFAKLRTTWSETKIIFISVHNMASRDLAKQKILHDQTNLIRKKWSVDFVDIYESGQLNTNIPSMLKYTNPTTAKPEGDSTHPNETGYQVFYVPLITSKMR